MLDNQETYKHLKTNATASTTQDFNTFVNNLLDFISLHQHAMRHVNRLRSISNLVPRFALFSIYNSFILPIFDYGSVVYDTCSQSDALLLDSAQTTAAKLITGCFKTTANDAVLNDISLVKLGTRRE